MLGLDAAAIVHLVERVVAPLGLRLDRSSPMVDARLPDGSRLHAVIPPLSVDGPCVTIRRFAARPVALEDSASRSAGAPSSAGRSRAGWNVLVAGATSAGKTTLLNALSLSFPAASGSSPSRRPPSCGSRSRTWCGSRPSAQRRGSGWGHRPSLVRAALRMRPDRLVVGEVRAGEALDMLQALNTGHDGSLSTIHANGPADAVVALETLVLLADRGLPLAGHPGADRGEHRPGRVRGARSDGVRRVETIAEVAPGPIATGAASRVRPARGGAGAVATSPARGARHGAAVLAPSRTEVARRGALRARRRGAGPPRADRPSSHLAWTGAGARFADRGGDSTHAAWSRSTRALSAADLSSLPRPRSMLGVAGATALLGTGVRSGSGGVRRAPGCVVGAPVALHLARARHERHFAVALPAALEQVAAELRGGGSVIVRGEAAEWVDLRGRRATWLGCIDRAGLGLELHRGAGRLAGRARRDRCAGCLGSARGPRAVSVDVPPTRSTAWRRRCAIGSKRLRRPEVALDPGADVGRGRGRGAARLPRVREPWSTRVRSPASCPPGSAAVRLVIGLGLEALAAVCGSGASSGRRDERDRCSARGCSASAWGTSLAACRSCGERRRVGAVARVPCRLSAPPGSPRPCGFVARFAPSAWRTHSHGAVLRVLGAHVPAPVAGAGCRRRRLAAERCRSSLDLLGVARRGRVHAVCLAVEVGRARGPAGRWWPRRSPALAPRARPRDGGSGRPRRRRPGAPLRPLAMALPGVRPVGVPRGRRPSRAAPTRGGPRCGGGPRPAPVAARSGCCARACAGGGRLVRVDGRVIPGLGERPRTALAVVVPVVRTAPLAPFHRERR